MTTLNKVLLAALVVQGGLVLVTRWPSGGPSEPRDLVEFPNDQIASIQITGRLSRDEKPPGPPVKLVQTDGKWAIANAENFPAEAGLVQPVLDAIDKLQVRDPVATSSTSHTNLAVSEDLFTRKLEIESKDGQKKTFYLGAGPGKTVMVRADGEDEVYEVRGFTAWSVAEAPNRYFERELLKVDVGTIDTATIQRPGQPPIEFHKLEDGKWTLSSLAPDQTLDQAATTTFLSKLLTVRISDPASAGATPAMGLDGPNATVVSWSTPGGSPTHYQVGAAVPEKTNRFYLRSDTKPFVVEVVGQSVENAVTKPIDPLIAVAGMSDGVLDIDQ